MPLKTIEELQGNAEGQQWEEYEERAAIMEYDGKMSRAEAEAKARKDCGKGR